MPTLCKGRADINICPHLATRWENMVNTIKIVAQS